MRAIVGFLGETNQHAWWDTSFLSPTGLRFLRINFPRSAVSAGLKSTIAAAQNLHDKRIGIGRVNHLFRLPYSLEQVLSVALRENADEELLDLIASEEVALEQLRSIAGSTKDEPVGPVQLSGTSVNKNLIEEMAGYYYHAFSNGKQVFPYYTNT